MFPALFFAFFTLVSTVNFAQSKPVASVFDTALGASEVLDSRDIQSSPTIEKRFCAPEGDRDPDPECNHHPVHPPHPATPTPTPPGQSSYTVNDPQIPRSPITVKLNVPPVIDGENWNSVLFDNLKTNLPSVLQQYGVDAALIHTLLDEGVEVLFEAVIAFSGGQSFDEVDIGDDGPGGIARRSLFGKFIKWIAKVVVGIVKTAAEVLQDIECGIFVNTVLPGYILADLGFKSLNGNTGVPTTADQDYFLSPIYGSISHDDDIQIHYGATFASGYLDRDSVTFGKRVYIKAAAPKSTASTPLLQDKAFQDATKVLLSEFAYVRKQAEKGYLSPVYGVSYLFDFCKAGYSFPKTSVARDAADKKEAMNDLLTDRVGTQFMDKWKTGSWQFFGYPTTTRYTRYQNYPNHYYLPYQNGGLTLDCNPVTGCQ